ncbi:hypothetical protein A1O3_08604 [Capronia epimyces CBS 606.96]|uniref:F-box domain-containing protein n=1 Tax=Capronia epimyces CBS 606.96 TaxID=1182542 RepID=W9XFU5_9EURO|nr:uncharacterized protein A1O3_08604 [Capronia epimyces CBS 606.96]EXJ79103.1 hypothetical protein A1O3_08604 [Capronia epimyces CBS 606.96]
MPGRRVEIKRKHSGFVVPSSILTPAKQARKVRQRRRNAMPFDTKKAKFSALPNEILLMVFSHLDVPSRITLGLTCRFFAAMSQCVPTDLNDKPSVVKYHAKCQNPPCLYANHISDRRILLLQIKNWMPRGYRLCWVCLKYTKIGRSAGHRWHSTTRVRFDGYCRLNLPATDGLREIHAHRDCSRSGPDLHWWAVANPGAAGGFIRSNGSVTPSPSAHIYNAGF